MDLYVLAGMVVALWLDVDMLVGVFLRFGLLIKSCRRRANGEQRRCETCGLRAKDPVEL